MRRSDTGGQKRHRRSNICHTFAKLLPVRVNGRKKHLTARLEMTAPLPRARRQLDLTHGRTKPAAMTAPQFDPQMLLDPAAYPWLVDEVRLIETHISWVYLAGDRVVKLKRPVELGFVDFRDPAKRKRGL